MHNRSGFGLRGLAQGILCLLSLTGSVSAETPSGGAVSPAPLAEKFRQARTLAESDHCAQAIPLLREIAESSTAGELAGQSARLLLDCDKRTQNYPQLEQDANKLCAISSLRSDTDFQRICAAIESGLVRRNMELIEKAGDFRKAAELALAFVKQHPDDPKLDELYYNSAVLLDRAGDSERAQRTRSLLLLSRPTSALAPRALFANCQRYAQIGAADRAAWCFEEYARRWPSMGNETEGAFVALQAALRLRVSRGDSVHAEQDLDQFQKLYGGRQQHHRAMAELFLFTALVYENPALYKKLAAHLRQYLKTFGPVGGAHAEIIATTRLAELLWERSCPVPMVDGICLSRRASAEPSSQKSLSGFTKRAAPLVQEVQALCARVIGLSRGLSNSGADASKSADDPPSPDAVRIQRAKDAVDRVNLILSDLEYEHSSPSHP